MTTSEAPHWRGINHLAMVTPDMDASVRFYLGVLGMRLVCTTMAGPMRLFFFEIGPENTIAFMAVAEAFLAKHLGGRTEAIGDGFKGSSVTIPQGADLVPGVKEALPPAAVTSSD